MSIAERLEREHADIELNATRALFANIIQPNQYVGEVYSLGYEQALVQIHDHHRQRVGGIPSLSFLIATRVDPAGSIDFTTEDCSVILLRVMDAAPLPNDQEANRIRVESAQRVSGELGMHWEAQGVMDATTAHLLSFAGVKCRIIGTFFVDRNPRFANQPDRPLILRFGSDISNYYPNRGLKVFKPHGKALRLIVNYRDPEQTGPAHPVEIGHVRYASTNRSFQGVNNVGVNISPDDLKAQKTALFGMTRSGKSNTTKIILQSVFRLRFGTSDPVRIGQLVFDPNGEYANENAQDGNQSNPAAIKNVWQTHSSGQRDDVITYGITPHPNDPNRRLMLLNFFADQNLQIGKSIIDGSITQDYIYLRNFKQVALDPPDPNDRSAMTRHNRRVLTYRALLARAGFSEPNNLRPDLRNLFSAELRTALTNSTATNSTDHQSAAAILGNASPTWQQVAQALEYLSDFIEHPQTGYGAFNAAYIQRPNGSGESWADEDLKKLLTMFRYPNGVRLIAEVRQQHAADTTRDYVEDIYDALVAGRLVIVDQSSGDPIVNKSSADRILWHIFRQNQSRFRTANPMPEILIYIEEAHNLLPNSKEDDLQDVWVRTAKEGAKYRIGMVYATQEVSSIQRNILKNTANWFIGHLNNTDETRELTKYYDFADFEASIRRSQDKGFVRMKTLSNLFVVPVQVNRFEVVADAVRR